MTEVQRLFLVQARTDFVVFELFQKETGLPACHALHYLQMATELLGKAFAWKQGKPKKTHRAFVPFLRRLTKNRQAQKTLGLQGRNENWESLIRKSVEMALSIEDLAPALSRDGPNPEYPWPEDAPQHAPVEHSFDIWRELQETAPGRQFIHLTRRLFAAANAFL